LILVLGRLNSGPPPRPESRRWITRYNWAARERSPPSSRGAGSGGSPARGPPIPPTVPPTIPAVPAGPPRDLGGTRSSLREETFGKLGVVAHAGRHTPGIPLTLTTTPHDHEKLQGVTHGRHHPTFHVCVGPEEDRISGAEGPEGGHGRSVMGPLRLEGQLSRCHRPDKISGRLAPLRDDEHLTKDHLNETVHRGPRHHPQEELLGRPSPGKGLPEATRRPTRTGLIRIEVGDPDSPGVAEGRLPVYRPKRQISFVTQ